MPTLSKPIPNLCQSYPSISKPIQNSPNLSKPIKNLSKPIQTYQTKTYENLFQPIQNLPNLSKPIQNLSRPIQTKYKNIQTYLACWKLPNLLKPIPGISETLEKVSVSTTFAQSRLVSVSTTTYLLSLEESRYRQLWIFWVSKSLSLDNLDKSKSRKVSVSTTSMPAYDTWVKKYISVKHHPEFAVERRSSPPQKKRENFWLQIQGYIFFKSTNFIPRHLERRYEFSSLPFLINNLHSSSLSIKHFESY